MSQLKQYLTPTQLLYFVFVVLIGIPIFINLDLLPLRLWDEALVSVNAQEMYADHNFIVTHSGGLPEMWNTKPPMLTWLQVFSMQLFGMSDLAVRLPSAVSGFITCLLLIWFCRRFFQSVWVGIFASLILVTSPGFVVEHSVRNADYDSLLVLFSTATVLFFYTYINTYRNVFLTLFFAALTLGTLTKGVSILMMLPGIIVFTLISKNTILVLTNFRFYVGLFCFVGIVLGYYFLRENYNSGYLQAVWKNELGGRYSNVVEFHDGGFWFYYNRLIDGDFSFYYFFIPIGSAFGFYSQHKTFRLLILYLFLVALSFFVIISLAQTKLFWYSLPIYPLLSIITAYPIFLVFDFLSQQNILSTTKNILPFVFIYLIFIAPYQKIMNKVYQASDNQLLHSQEAINYYLKSCLKHNINLDGYKYIYNDYSVHIDFYTTIFKHNLQRIEHVNLNQIQAKDKVIVSVLSDKKYIEKSFSYRILEKKDSVTVYLLGTKLETNSSQFKSK